MAKFEAEEEQMKYRSVWDKKMRKGRETHNQCLTRCVVHNKYIWILFACLGFLTLVGLQNTQFATPAIRLLHTVLKCCSVFHCSDTAQNSGKHRQICHVLPTIRRESFSPNTSL